MALVIGEDTFGSLLEASAYFRGRVHGSAWGELEAEVQENALRMAAFHLSNLYIWRGTLALSDQLMSFPRDGIYDQENRLVSKETVPLGIKYAQFELAMQWAVADQLTPLGAYLTASDPKSGLILKREKLGPLEKEYAESASLMFSLAEGRMSEKVYPLVDMYVRPYALRRVKSNELRLVI